MQAHLCLSCGVCASLCAVDAISYQETVGGHVHPLVDQGRCIECGLCLAVCPGRGFGLRLAADFPPDPFVGVARECFVGRATDAGVHANSQSGGLVTALLLHALRQSMVRGAVVATSRPGSPPLVAPVVATSEQEIAAAQGSKYVPVPLLSVLRTVEERRLVVALVGLPCHLHGLRNFLDVRPEVAALIPIEIGLVCDRVLTTAGRDFLISRSGLGTEAVDLRFRDKLEGGWPGSVRVTSASGRSVVLSPRERLGIKDAFTPARCRLCFDKMNVLADLTVGDPWGIASPGKSSGESVVIARTPAGSRLLHDAIEAGAVSVAPIEYTQVVKGQKIDQRRLDWGGYNQAWARMGLELPNYGSRVATTTGNHTAGDRTYDKELRHSLSLDTFTSRLLLIETVERSLVTRNRLRWVLLPVRMVRVLVGRAYRLVQTKATGARPPSKRSNRDDCRD